MYQHLIDRADRRLRAVRLAKIITVGGPFLALLLTTAFLATGCGRRDDGAGDLWRGVRHMEDNR